MIALQELDRKQFFQPVLETISLTLGLPACIWLADETGEALRIAAATELSEDYIRKAVLRLDEPNVVSDVFATGQTIVVTDIASDDRWKYKTEAAAVGLKSAMVVPLRVKKKIVGVLDVYTDKVRDFSDSEKTLIERFAAQVAVAQRRVRDLAILNEVSLLISSELRPADLFKCIMQAAERVLDCQRVSIFLVDKSGDLVLEVASSAGIARQRFAQGVGLVGWVAQTKRSELVPDAVKRPQFVPGLSSDLVERSMLLTPIILLEDKVIGVISADMEGLSGFDEHDQMLLEALASQAAVAVRNARLFEQREALQSIARDITSILDKDQLLQTILEQSLRLLECKEGSIALFDRSTRELTSQYAVGKQKWEGIPLGEGLIGTAAELQMPVRVGDVTRHPQYIRHVEETRSELDVPLLVGDELIGVLNAESPRYNAFSEEDERLAMALASQAAVVLYNTALFEQRSALVDFGQVVTSGIRLREDEVLELIYSQASKLMDTDNMYIALYDEALDTVRFGLAFVDGRRIDMATEEGWQPRRAGRGRTEEVIRTRKPLFHATKAEAEAWYTQPEHKEYIGKPFASWLGVPMMVGEKILGVIATYHSTRDYVYSIDNLMILQAMVNQAAIALDNSHMFYDVNRRLESLVEFGQAVTSGIRLREDEVLELIYSQASTSMDTDNMYIALYDEATDTVRFGLAFVDGRRIDMATEEGWQPRQAGKGKTEEAIRTKKPLFHATKAEAEAYYAQPEHKEYTGGGVWASWLGVPMMVGERVLGVIAAYHPTRDYVYSGDDLEILQAMVNLAAAALDNVRLYEETRRLHDEVVAAKQLATLGTAIAALQHRINNTFNIIVPNVTRLRKRVDMTDETIVEILDIIERNARYTSNIIARIQEPLREIEAQDVDVNAVLSDMVGKVKEQWQADPARSTIAVVLNLDDSIPLIQAPIGQIAEVFYNLVDNAYRAMKVGGQLVVTSCLTDGEIRVRVQDSSPGIPPQVQQRLFVKPVPSKEPGGGAGLGLWLSRLILQSIGGDIAVEISDPTGTTMLVQIPAPERERRYGYEDSYSDH